MEVQGPTVSSHSQATDLKSSQKFDATSFANRMSSFDQKCTCCPYGYHIDLDFLRYLDSLYSSETLKKLKKIRYNKDGSMPRTPKAQQAPQVNLPSTSHTTTTTPESLVTCSSNRRGGKEVVVELDLISPSHEQPTAESSQQSTAVAVSPKSDSKFRTEAELFLSSSSDADSKEGQVSSLHSVGRRFDLSRPVRTVSSPRHTSELSIPDRPVHLTLTQPDELISATSCRPFSRGSSSSPVDSEASSSISPAVLAAIREQMAVSLHRMKELEEQVKVIPALQARISMLIRENQLLTQTVESSNVSLSRGAGPLVGLRRRVDAWNQTEESVRLSPDLWIKDASGGRGVDMNFNRQPEECREVVETVEVSSAVKAKSLDKRFYSVAIQCTLLTDDTKGLFRGGLKEEMTSVAVDVRPNVISRCVGTDDGFLVFPAEDRDREVSTRMFGETYEERRSWGKKFGLDKSTSVDESLAMGREIQSNEAHTREIDVEEPHCTVSCDAVHSQTIEDNAAYFNEDFERALGKDLSEESAGDELFQLTDYRSMEYEAAMVKTKVSCLQSDSHSRLSTVDAEGADFADEGILVEKAVGGSDNVSLTCTDVSELHMKRGTLSLETNLEVHPEQEVSKEEQISVELCSDNEDQKQGSRKSSVLDAVLIKSELDNVAMNVHVTPVNEESVIHEGKVADKGEEISVAGEGENKGEEVVDRGEEISEAAKLIENTDEDMMDLHALVKRKDEDVLDLNEEAEIKEAKCENELEEAKNKDVDNENKYEETKAVDKGTTYPDGEDAVQKQRLLDKDTFGTATDLEKEIFKTDSDMVKADEESCPYETDSVTTAMETDKETVVVIETRQERTNANEADMTRRNDAMFLVSTDDARVITETALPEASEKGLSSRNTEAIGEAAVSLDVAEDVTQVEDDFVSSEADTEVDMAELERDLNVESLTSFEFKTTETVQSLQSKPETSFQGNVENNSAVHSSLADEEKIVSKSKEMNSNISKSHKKEEMRESHEKESVVSEPTEKKAEGGEVVETVPEIRESEIRESNKKEPELRESNDESEIDKFREKESDAKESVEKESEESEVTEKETKERDSTEKESEERKPDENRSTKVIELPSARDSSHLPLAPSIDHIEIICIPSGCHDSHHESIIVTERELCQLALKEHGSSSSRVSVLQPSRGRPVSGSVASGDEDLKVLQQFAEMKDREELCESMEQLSGMELTTDSMELVNQKMINKETEQSEETDENMAPVTSMEPDEHMMPDMSIEPDENMVPKQSMGPDEDTAPDTSMEPDEIKVSDTSIEPSEQTKPSDVTEPVGPEPLTLAETAQIANEMDHGESSQLCDIWSENGSGDFQTTEFASTTTKRVVITETMVERRRTDQQQSNLNSAIDSSEQQKVESSEVSAVETIASEYRDSATTTDSLNPSSESLSADDARKTADSFVVRPDVLAACAVYAEYLRDPTLAVDSDNVSSCVDFLRDHWFELAGRKTSDVGCVEFHLDEYRTFGTSLARSIVNMADSDGNTAMHYAVSYGNMEVISVLLDTGFCNVDKQNKAGYTAIMLASLLLVDLDQHEPLVLRLFHSGDVNATSATSGQTSLMLAASHGRNAVVALLLESGAEVDLQDEDGSTALMCAAEHGHADVIRTLLSHPDCDSSITDIDGSTALSIAMEEGHHDIGVFLYAHMKAIDDRLLEED